MQVFSQVISFYSNSPLLAILISVASLLLLVLMVSLVVIIIRCSKRPNADSKTVSNKNNLELNEEQFKDNIEIAKGGNASYKVGPKLSSL